MSGDLTFSFDRTYEELKRQPRRLHRTMWRGFDRTYEELKPSRGVEEPRICGWVLIVPMRN